MTRSDNRNSYSSPLFLLTIIINIINLQLAQSDSTFYNILLEDELSVSSPPMNVTCKAGRRYIAGDSLRQGDVMNITYTFDPDHRVTSLSCTFKIGPKKWTNFNLFDYTRDVVGGRCDEDVCEWSATEDGVSEYYDNLYRLVYPWRLT
ncbi:hypothetical protein ACP275_07G068000 [Erythranthe tilingii]